MSQDGISLRRLFRRFRFRIVLTWILVLGEAGLLLFFPLVMGVAIDDYLEDSSCTGLWQLALLGLASLVVGAARRFYDTRVYSGIYARIAPELVEKEKRQSSSTSVVSARAGLATELVEFFENSLPAILDSFVSLCGTLLIILFLNRNVFFACMASMILVALIYWATSGRTYRWNSGYNEQLERQVAVLEGGDRGAVKSHFKSIMKWNIRLSDLETTNFSLSWFLLMAVLVYAIVAIIEGGVTAHGRVLAILMYVFSYIESVVTLPLFYQHFVRLKEISHRLEGETMADESQ